MQRALHIKILYGSSWGFPQRYEELASLLSRKIKTTKLTISGRKVNRKAAFEIFFNDVCVHSKVGTYYQELMQWDCFSNSHQKIFHLYSDANIQMLHYLSFMKCFNV